MRKLLLHLTLVGVLALLVVGCSNDQNPVQSDPANEQLALAKIVLPYDAQVDSVKFSVTVTATNGQTVNVHRVTSAWDETSVTWNDFSGGFAPEVVASFTPENPGTYTVDITSLVQGWADESVDNYGLLLDQIDADTPLTVYASREAEDSHPTLEVCYTSAGEAMCQSFDADMDAYIYATQGDANYGAEAVLQTGRIDSLDGDRQALVWFEIEVEPTPADLGDMVWNDMNRDGVQDVDEPGLEGVTVNLFDCTDTLRATTTTDADGMYLFDSLQPGDYYVELTPPSGYLFSPQDQGDDDALDSDFDPAMGKTGCITLEEGIDNLTVDAGLYFAPASVGDYVWNDQNKNGLQDEGEPGMAGVSVKLYTCAEEMVAETTTDADGMYMFENLIPGDYYLMFTLPEDYIFSMRDAGDDDMLDSDVDGMTGMTGCITLAADEENMSVDAGMYIPYAKLGDFVWNDMNENGMQDEGEMGIEGIEVNLYTCADEMVATRMTDEDGMYVFDSIVPGDYYLTFTAPFGYIFTDVDAGGDDMLDSDADPFIVRTIPWTGRTMCITLDPDAEDYSWDAGLIAFDGCTYGKGYWKNHAGFGPQDDEVSRLLPIWLGDDDGAKSMAVTDPQIAFDLLQQHTYGEPSNGITKLYAHFLTAKLNVFNYANPEDIYETILDVDAFLAEYDYTDWDMLSKDQRKDVLRWKGELEEFNEGYIGPGHCDEDDDGDYDDDGDDYGMDDSSGEIEAESFFKQVRLQVDRYLQR
jgi:hypothetical protein